MITIQVIIRTLTVSRSERRIKHESFIKLDDFFLQMWAFSQGFAIIIIYFLIPREALCVVRTQHLVKLNFVCLELIWKNLLSAFLLNANVEMYFSWIYFIWFPQNNHKNNAISEEKKEENWLFLPFLLY